MLWMYVSLGLLRDEIFKNGLEIASVFRPLLINYVQSKAPSPHRHILYQPLVQQHQT